MFVEVDEKDLVSGTKYAMFVGIFACRYSTATLINKGPGKQWFYCEKEHTDTNTYNILRDMKLKHKKEFFAFVPQKERIQQAMEKRALDKILKRVVNEDFIWYRQTED